MFKFIGSVAKGIFKGVKDILPIAQAKDSLQDLKVRTVLEKGRSSGSYNTKQAQRLIEDFMDILDDGKRNDSVDKAKVETVTRIVTGFLPVLAWIIHGIITGNWIIF